MWWSGPDGLFGQPSLWFADRRHGWGVTAGLPDDGAIVVRVVAFVSCVSNGDMVLYFGLSV